MKDVRTIVNTKKFIYFVRSIGWLSLLVGMYISSFHREVLDKYPPLGLALVLVFFLSDYKVNYKYMKMSKSIFIFLITIIVYLIYRYANYLINFK